MHYAVFGEWNKAPFSKWRPEIRNLTFAYKLADIRAGTPKNAQNTGSGVVENSLSCFA